MKIKIIVATHKSYKMPTDPMYVPLQVEARESRLWDISETMSVTIYRQRMPTTAS